MPDLSQSSHPSIADSSIADSSVTDLSVTDLSVTDSSITDSTLKDSPISNPSIASDCIFCRIHRKEIPAKIVYEDDLCLAFHDISPKAKVHLLIIPKKHIESLLHLSPEDTLLMGHLTLQIPALAKMFGLGNGFKISIHTGHQGGQEVPHLHYHLLGGPLK